MKHKAFALWEVVAVLLILAVLAAILFPVLAPRPHHSSPSASCRSNLKQIGLGFLQYIQDYDEKFPAVAASGGWANAVQPYVKTWQIFHCPSAQSQRDAQTTDYYFNARLSGVKQEKIESTADSILAGEGASGKTPDYSLMQLPDAWRTDEKSPAYRHNGVANTLFVDGRVRSLKPKKITLDKPGKNNPTFLLGRS